MNSDQIALVKSILIGCIGKLPEDGPFKDIPIEVEEVVVHVRGMVIGGIIKFGTIFIK